MPKPAAPTGRILITWNSQVKAWDLTGVINGPRHDIVINKRARSRVELDKSAMVLLLEQLAYALESWVF
jgi:hypothetical protein